MRYRVSDLPRLGLSAFTPIPTTTPAASSQGLLEVDGAPGDTATPSPRPAAVPSLTMRGGVNSAQGSDVSPDVILPAVYIARAANLGPEQGDGIGMWRRRFCELPLPAVSPGRIPKVAMGPPIVAGRRAIAWPRAFQRFPNRTSSAGG